ncbi:hypothetical protein HO133_000539 [Letharia lupina]|uniref:Glucose-methanol-choline oxidoreductase N-terminal domain-containing protein n=1 Tax=Letharia lupina TaxID=560253 RepID=A0A8H6CIC8_9LECA|nr:uncharacterized protein HO133_000539 [Letharia lupina]KAF6223696.1 hypothetical protein HO133_000539 [Letharia lupina]
MDASTSISLLQAEYDYVVIGGGTAGLVVACRLSENDHVKVIVLEAGNNHLTDPRINIPAGWSAVLGSEVDWAFQTSAQAQVADSHLGTKEHLGGRVLRHPQGRVLGGSSAINAEAFIAPSSTDLEAWEHLGNPGWNWQVMMPYYRKCYTLTAPASEVSEHLGIDWIDEDVRGLSGPIQASFQGAIQDPLSKAWVQTFKGLQHGLKRDPFAGEAMGGYSSPITVDPESKTRSYAANTYYASASHRPNLTVLTGVSVKNIILDTRNGPAIATGVHVSVNDLEHIVNASKEVILAAGAFQTPKLLELSGIGDRELLETHGIHVVIDNPNVGENLQDHLMTGISYEVMDGIFTGDGLMRQEPEITQMAMQMYTTAKAGPLCAGGIGSYAFMPLLNSLDGDKTADLERLLLDCKSQDPKDAIHFEFVRSILESDKKASASMFMFPAQVNLHNSPSAKNFTQDLAPGNYVSLGVALLHPLSRGSVHITSAHASQEPHIDPKYLSHALDVEIFATHLRFLERLAQSEPLASLLKPDGRRNHPTAFIRDMNGARDYVRQSAISNNHPACTCAMKPREKGGVVNERLVVYGTANLRVVDASIMPTIPGGNIQSSVYAVAERAADLIKEDAR